ncbi:hypothetical protein, partial [Pararcticibacter amylolyticus]
MKRLKRLQLAGFEQLSASEEAQTLGGTNNNSLTGIIVDNGDGTLVYSFDGDSSKISGNELSTGGVLSRSSFGLSGENPGTSLMSTGYSGGDWGVSGYGGSGGYGIGIGYSGGGYNVGGYYGSSGYGISGGYSGGGYNVGGYYGSSGYGISGGYSGGGYNVGGYYGSSGYGISGG